MRYADRRDAGRRLARAMGGLLACRLGAGELPIGYLGVGAGAAAALMAADEPGALRAAADLACEWFAHHLVAEPARAR